MHGDGTCCCEIHERKWEGEGLTAVTQNRNRRKRTDIKSACLKQHPAEPVPQGCHVFYYETRNNAQKKSGEEKVAFCWKQIYL